jgi:hypothetical protein
MLGERQRVAKLADAGKHPKAAVFSADKATSWLARLPASDSPLSLLESVGCRTRQRRHGAGGGILKWSCRPPVKASDKVRGNSTRPEPELAPATDRGLDAQLVPAPDRGLDELAA